MLEVRYMEKTAGNSSKPKQNLLKISFLLFAMKYDVI